MILFDKCMGVSDSCYERSALLDASVSSFSPSFSSELHLSILFSNLSGISEGVGAGVEDGWVELATLLRLKRTPKLAQPELLWSKLASVNGLGCR